MRRSVAMLVAALLASNAANASAQPAQDDAYERDQRRTERDVDRLGWAVPDFAKLQTGGFVGLAAVGVGYAAFDDILNATLLYGYTPKWHAGVDVHSFHFALSGRPFDVRLREFRIVPIYLGAGLLFNPDPKLFVKVPARYPESNYYPPTALHWTAHIGLEADYVPSRGVLERHGLYFEAVALDTYVFSYFENRQTVAFTDMFGSAIGYRAAF